jgi:hypothetical protein
MGSADHQTNLAVNAVSSARSKDAALASAIASRVADDNGGSANSRSFANVSLAS